jgi:hypothetical protein
VICGRGQRLLDLYRVPNDLFPPWLRAEIEDLNRDFVRSYPRPRAISRARPHLGSPRPAITTPSPITVADVGDVIDFGWDGAALLDRLIRLDYETIDDLTAKHEGDRNQWAPVFMAHPLTWRLLVQGTDVVAYWHFVPLFKHDYDLVKKGQLFDSQITADRIPAFEIPGTYDIYFVSFCVKVQYRRPDVMRLMMDCLLAVFTDLAQHGVFIRDICANAYSSSGVALCNHFEMDLLRAHDDHGTIFSGYLPDILRQPLARPHRQLRRLYGQ